MKKSQRRFPDINRKRVFAFFVCVISFLALYQTAQTIKDSKLFEIKEIVSLGADKKINLRSLLGKNIIKLNLKSLSARIKEEFYYVQEVKISRNLPNRLVIQIEKKVPVAKIKLAVFHKAEYFYIDGQGMLLNISDFPGSGERVIIDGLGSRLPGARAGKIYYDSVLQSVLNIIREKELCKNLTTYYLSRIEIEDQNNIIMIFKPNYRIGRDMLLVTQEIKVAISGDNIREKLVILARLLDRLRDQFGKIRYIDYRFKEPVVKDM